MKVLSVVGARPQFVKAAPLSAALRQTHDEFLVHTGQHYDDAMSASFFRQLNIPQPDVNLNVGSGGHGQQTAEMLVGIERLIQEQQPDWVLVYGDTNSTLAGALAAVKLHVPIAHVEAGLRSFDQTMPEEVNRVLTDHVSTLLFSPTQTGVDNLANEGIHEGVILTGDIMVDAVYQALPRAEVESTVHDDVGIDPHAAYAAVTIHRPINADDPHRLGAILAALNALEMPVVFPVHPRTQKAIHALDFTAAPHLHLITPLGYLDMLALVNAAAVLITDSGGLQKESYLLRTPCITVRSETEWTETVSSGWNRLVEAQQDAIITAVAAARAAQPDVHPDFYGDGKAAQRIIAAMAQH